MSVKCPGCGVKEGAFHKPGCPECWASSPEALVPERRHGDTGGRLLSEAEIREAEAERGRRL